ncbi:MAG: AAA family ATPase [Candidatus Woesearchaeota archaeon]
MERIAIYGKGGIGKSTISSSLSASIAHSGKKVIQIGCDPKRDSTIRLTDGERIPNVIDTSMAKQNDLKKADFVKNGSLGTDCVECGGPKPGVGCAGRGITKMFEIFEELDILDDNNYDVAIFDVLGDVVCGGFAAPMRKGFGDKIFIVISEEIMSLYAANNILHAIRTYEYNGIYFAGFIVNLRNNKANLDHIKRFIKATQTEIIATVPRNKLIVDAERKNKTVIEQYPDSEIATRFGKISGKVLGIDKSKVKRPNPIDDVTFNNVMLGE